VGKIGKVIACDPYRDTYHALDRNLASYSQAVVNHVAVVGRDGGTELFLDGARHSNHSVFAGNVGQLGYPCSRQRRIRHRSAVDEDVCGSSNS